MQHNIITTISAVAAGAAAMYYLDPEQGKRRRAIVRDKLTSASLHTTDATRAQGRRVAHRVKGWTAGLASRLPSRAAPPSPRQLHDRVRAHLGRLVSHPKAVHVEVLGDGNVRLAGHVLESEREALLAGVESVAGVTHVDNALMVHASAGHISELQGGARRLGLRGEGRARLWRALALMAPVAILAVTARPTTRRRGLVERLTAERHAFPTRIAPARKRRRYFSALRAS